MPPALAAPLVLSTHASALIDETARLATSPTRRRMLRAYLRAVALGLGPTDLARDSRLSRTTASKLLGGGGVRLLDDIQARTRESRGAVRMAVRI